jgi:hypothetical protein
MPTRQMGNERPGESRLNSTNGVEEEAMSEASTRSFEDRDEVEVANVSQEETQKSRRRSSIYTNSTLPSVGASTDSHSLYERRSFSLPPSLVSVSQSAGTGRFPLLLLQVSGPDARVRLRLHICSWSLGCWCRCQCSLSWCSNIPLHW